MDRPAIRPVLWLVLLAGGVHLLTAGLAIRHGALNPDEGFYGAAARAVMGGALPYRDFGYTQPPLLPYVNGAALQLTGGFGLYAQRTLNALWAVLSLILMAILITRRTTARTAVAWALLFSLSIPWLYFVHLGKTYALTGLLVMAAAWVWLERPAGWRKAALLGLLGVIGTGCRLPAAPLFAGLWLAALAERGDDRRDRRALFAVVLLGLAAASLLLPFWLAAPEAAAFWVFDFHRVSVPLKTWHLAWQETLTLAPALWLATALAIAALLRRRDLLTRSELLLGGATLIALAANLLPGGVYEEYAVPFLLTLAIPVATALHRATTAVGGKLSLATAGAIALAHVIVTPLVLWRDFPIRHFTVSQWLTPNAPVFNPRLPEQLAVAREIVTTLVPPGQPLVGPNLILALEANRPVPPELIMGPFSLNTTLPVATARQLHLLTPADYEAMLADPGVTLLAFFPQAQLNYGWTVPTFERLPDALARSWLDRYRRDFSIVMQQGNFLLLARTDSLPPAAPPVPAPVTSPPAR